MSEPTSAARSTGGGTSTAGGNTDWAITGALCAIAIVCLLLVFATAPSAPTAAAFAADGTALFPSLTDPSAAASIEITGWDDATAAATPFKVQRKNGLWVLPSYEDYPAEAEDRLIKITGNVIALTRGSLQSENASDHAGLGVIDPLDQNSTVLKGRGLRCVLRDDAEQVIADFVVGTDVPGQADFKFVRLTGEPTTYAVNMKDVDLTSDFYDWIEKDLLKIDAFKIRRLELDHYYVDEKKGTLEKGDIVTITKPQSTNQWVVEEIEAGESVNDDRIDEIVGALDELEIVGVRRKPKGISRALKLEAGAQITPQDQMDLQVKGFFLTERGLVSNDGEVRAWDEDGVLYVLRFGEIAPTAEKDVERRYVFVSAQHDAAYLPEPPEPPKAAGDKQDGGPKDGDDGGDDGDGGGKDKEGEKKTDGEKSDTVPGGGGFDAWQDGHADHGHDAPAPAAAQGVPDAADAAAADPARAEWKKKHDEWKRRVEAGTTRAKELNERFADWYYVVPGDTYRKLKATRSAVVLPKGSGGDGDKKDD